MGVGSALPIRWAAILAALFLSACSKPDGCGDVMQPPTEYDHPPIGMSRLWELSADEVTRTCEGLGISGPLLACSIGSIVVLPVISASTPRWKQDCLLHHEWGHQNGWPATHPNGRYI